MFMWLCISMCLLFSLQLKGRCVFSRKQSLTNVLSKLKAVTVELNTVEENSKVLVHVHVHACTICIYMLCPHLTTGQSTFTSIWIDAH